MKRGGPLSSTSMFNLGKVLERNPASNDCTRFVLDQVAPGTFRFGSGDRIRGMSPGKGVTVLPAVGVLRASIIGKQRRTNGD